VVFFFFVVFFPPPFAIDEPMVSGKKAPFLLPSSPVAKLKFFPLYLSLFDIEQRASLSLFLSPRTVISFLLLFPWERENSHVYDSFFFPFQE